MRSFFVWVAVYADKYIRYGIEPANNDSEGITIKDWGRPKDIIGVGYSERLYQLERIYLSFRERWLKESKLGKW